MQRRYLIRTYCALAWLLLLMGGNHSQVLCETESYERLCGGSVRFLAGDTLMPYMILNRDVVDVCQSTVSSKEFTLTIDLGESIAKADSLFAIEFVLGYRNDLIMIDGAWPLGTLCEFATYAPPRSYVEDIGYGNSAYHFDCGHTAPLYGTSKAIVLSGRFLKDTVACADILFAELYLGSEFNLPYKKVLIDTVSLCSKNVYNAANTITVGSIEHDNGDTLQLNSLDSIISIPFTLMEVANSKNLQSFDVEFELPAEDIGNIEFIAEDSVTYCNSYTTSLTANGCKVTVFIDDSRPDECLKDYGQNVWFRLKLRRKKAEASLNELHYKVTNINSLACSQNGLGGDMLLNCPALTDIAAAPSSEILVSDIGDIVTVRGGGFVQEYELYNSLGSLMFSRKYDITSNLSSIEIAKRDFTRGVYILRLTCRTLDMSTSSSYIKLIIN